jgi:predicted ATPase
LPKRNKERDYSVHAHAGRIVDVSAPSLLVTPGPVFMVAHIKREKKIDELIGPRHVSPRAPPGLYLYGNVGCGRRNISFVFLSSYEDVNSKGYFVVTMSGKNFWLCQRLKLWV